MEGMKPPLYRWQGSPYWWMEAFHIREVDKCCHSSLHGGTYPFHSPLVLFGLAQCDLVPWVVAFIMGFTIHQCQWTLTSFPLPYVHVPSEVCSHIILPEVFTCPQWMHWLMSMAEVIFSPFFHPREALLVGHWVTTLPLFSCGILFFSPLTEVVLHGVGLVHLSHAWQLPIHKGMPTSDATRRSWFWWRIHDLPCGFITL